MHANASAERVSRSSTETSSSGAVDNDDAATRTHIEPVGLLHLLRSAGPHLFGLAELYTDLIQVEWVLERRRLQHMLLLGLFGFSCWLALLLLIVVSALLLSWPTPYRAAVVAVLFGLLGLGVVFVSIRLRQLSRAGQRSFAGLREELADDLLLLRQQL